MRHAYPRRRSVLYEALHALATLVAAVGVAAGLWFVCVVVLLAGQS